MRHVSVWPAYVLYITLQEKFIHTRTVAQLYLSPKWSVRNICDQSFFLAPWVLRLHENLCQQGTWETVIPSSLFLSFPCVALMLFISDSLHPINIAPLQTQLVGCNEYFTWRLDSGRLCFRSWFMCDSLTTLTKFDFLHCVSQLMCRRVRCACLQR